MTRLPFSVLVAAAIGVGACGASSHREACFTSPSGQPLCGQAADSYCAQTGDPICYAYQAAKAQLASPHPSQRLIDDLKPMGVYVRAS